MNTHPTSPSSVCLTGVSTLYTAYLCFTGAAPRPALAPSARRAAQPSRADDERLQRLRARRQDPTRIGELRLRDGGSHPREGGAACMCNQCPRYAARAYGWTCLRVPHPPMHIHTPPTRLRRWRSCAPARGASRISTCASSPPAATSTGCARGARRGPPRSCCSFAPRTCNSGRRRRWRACRTSSDWSARCLPRWGAHSRLARAACMISPRSHGRPRPSSTGTRAGVQPQPDPQGAAVGARQRDARCLLRAVQRAAVRVGAIARAALPAVGECHVVVGVVAVVVRTKLNGQTL